MLPPPRRGFSLIELMIVIAIIGILVAVALPQFTTMTEDAKKSKAKHDTSEIAKQVAKYVSLEGRAIEGLHDLKGKYMSNIDTLRDPWAQPYGIDLVYGQVYSKGPDGKRSPVKDNTWNDDVVTNYVGALALVEARLEIDPDTTTDETTAYDRLFLIFNKGVVPAADAFDLGPSTSAAQDRDAYPAHEDGDARDGKSIRWYEGTRPKFQASYSPFPDGAVAAVYRTTDSRVVCFAFPPGYTEVFKTTTWINLTGAKKDPNPFFLGHGGTGGAEATGLPVRIVTVQGGAGFELLGFTPGEHKMPEIPDDDGFGLKQPKFAHD